MNKFRVFDIDTKPEDIENEFGCFKVECCDAADAAEKWADKYHSDYDCPDEMDCIVVDEEGNQHKFCVFAEPSIEYTAREHGESWY